MSVLLQCRLIIRFEVLTGLLHPIQAFQGSQQIRVTAQGEKCCHIDASYLCTCLRKFSLWMANTHLYCFILLGSVFHDASCMVQAQQNYSCINFSHLHISHQSAADCQLVGCYQTMTCWWWQWTLCSLGTIRKASQALVLAVGAPQSMPCLWL